MNSARASVYSKTCVLLPKMYRELDVYGGRYTGDGMSDDLEHGSHLDLLMGLAADCATGKSRKFAQAEETESANGLGRDRSRDSADKLRENFLSSDIAGSLRTTHTFGSAGTEGSKMSDFESELEIARAWETAGLNNNCMWALGEQTTDQLLWVLF
ncbi:hypothetical protein J6590_003503 [Homalodisca vitripennis]|nr:hypothetical protein J6590_003503 [Homalodisca vitripennis]